jgi:uncharacterized membrane protein
MLCYGVCDFIYKRSAQVGVPAHYLIMLQARFFCPLVLLYAALTHSLVIELAALWGGVAGLFIFIAFYNFLRSLTTGAVSINAPIFRMNFVVTVVLAVLFLGEPLGPSKLSGLALSLAATWLLSGTGMLSSPEVSRRSLFQVLLATLALGAANFFHKLGLEAGVPPATMVSAHAIVFTACAMLFGWINARTARPQIRAWIYAVPAALALLAAFLFFLNALNRGEASVVVPIAQMGFIPAAALGVVVLKETLTSRKIIGLVVAVAALVVLSAS